MIPFYFTDASYIDCLVNLWIFCMCIWLAFSASTPLIVHPHLPALFLSILFCCLFPQDLLHPYNRNVVSGTRACFFAFVLEDSNNTFTCLAEYNLGLLLMESVLKIGNKNLWSHVPIILFLWHPSNYSYSMLPPFSFFGVPWPMGFEDDIRMASIKDFLSEASKHMTWEWSLRAQNVVQAMQSKLYYLLN